MALLTTSQLTFYDLKDAYHVEINPDCIVINCDEKGISKEETNVDISYGIYCGSTRVPGTAKIINFEINGSQIDGTITDCNTTDDGHVQFVIPKNINLTDIDSVYIQFKEENVSDAEDFTFDKYIQLIKVTDGASGTGLVFKIYSEDGTVFREDMSQINLETVLFIGESRIDLDETGYKWEYDAGLGNWVSLGNGSTLTVEKPASDDPIKWAFKTIKCTINYNGNDYADYISLTDDVAIYTSEVRYFNSTNVLHGEDEYLVAYMALYRNGEEIDLLPANQYASAESIDNFDIIITDVKKEDETEYGADDVGALLYFIVKDSNKLTKYNIVLGQFNGVVWNVVDPETIIGSSYECVYENSKAYNNLARSMYNEANKIMIVSKQEINKSLAINFKAYKKTNLTQVSEAIGNIVDANDPIISNFEPENPANGQLWIDTSVTPNIIKVCKYKLNNGEKVIEWIESNKQIGGKVHTSKPSSYSINDVWILNEGEICSYSIDMTEVVELPPEFTKLECIESTGTQYIDTGFKPKYNSRVVADVSDLYGSAMFVFGVRDTESSSAANQFSVYRSSATTIRSDYFGTNKSINVENTTGRTIVDRNGDTVSIFDNIITNDSVTSGECTKSLYLFALNNAGSATLYASMKLYSCKIYDNDELVQHLVPCSNNDGIVGLYDVKNKIFYSNSGTGEFIGHSKQELPDGYTRLVYLESTGTQYIDTGWTFGSNNVNARIVSDTIMMTGADDWAVTGIGGGVNLYYGYNPSTGKICYGNGGKDIVTSALYTGNRCVFDVNLKNKTVLVTDKITNSYILNLSNITTSTPSKEAVNFYLFGRNSLDGGTVLRNERIYSCRIYDDDILVRDFIPCMREDDGVYGLYDKSNDVFYVNAGTGDFIGLEKRDLPTGYTQLEYIESSGTQYIDTNYIPTTDNLKIDTKFMYTSLGSWRALCGSGNADDTQWSLIPITNGSSNLTFYTGMSSQLGSLSIAANKIYKLSAQTKDNILSYTLNETSENTNFTGSIYKENSIYIFTQHSGNDSFITSLACSARIYDFKIYDNDVLVRDLIPCINSDSNIGLYDIVNNVFYPNVGTGNFIAGVEIVNENDVQNENIVSYEYGPGSMLRSSSSRTEEDGFVASDWSDTDPKLTEMRDNIAQYFQFNADTGLIIGQKDQKFYVNLTATEMGFYDNSNPDDPNKKVVSIGNQAAIIKHLTVEEGTSFNCNSQANFNNDINIYNPYKDQKVGFVWKIEANGSLSLIVM